MFCLPGLLDFLAGTTKKTAIEGCTPSILAAAVHANRTVASHAIGKVMLTGLTLGGISIS